MKKQISYETKFSIIKDCKIGKGTVIRDFVNLYKATIGKNCKIGAYVYIEPHAKIGNDVLIRPYSLIGEKIIIEDNVYIGPGVHTMNDLYPDPKKKTKVLKTIIKKNAVIGACAIIYPITVGRNSLVAAGAVVTKDVPDYAVVAGIPAKIIGSTKDPDFRRKQTLRNTGKDPRLNSMKKLSKSK